MNLSVGNGCLSHSVTDTMPRLYKWDQAIRAIALRVVLVQFSSVQGPFLPNPELNFRFSSANLVNLELNQYELVREVQFRFKPGSNPELIYSQVSPIYCPHTTQSKI